MKIPVPAPRQRNRPQNGSAPKNTDISRKAKDKAAPAEEEMKSSPAGFLILSLDIRSSMPNGLFRDRDAQARIG